LRELDDELDHDVELQRAVRATQTEAALIDGQWISRSSSASGTPSAPEAERPPVCVSTPDNGAKSSHQTKLAKVRDPSTP
jgi:hypothetical protein